MEDTEGAALSKLSEDDDQEKNMLTGVSGAPVFGETLWPKLKTLTRIDLCNSNLSELPDTIGDITGLQYLEVSHNMLKSLPASIGLLQCLSKLILSFNKLSSLPDAFRDLINLDYLDISHNEFEVPPRCLEVGCVKVSYLDVSYNKIREWSVGPMCAYGLTNFICSHNHLEVNPAWLWGDFCRSLKDLDLSFNPFNNPAYFVRAYSLYRTGVTVALKNLNVTNCGLWAKHLDLLHKLKALEKLRMGNMSMHEQRACSKREQYCAKENFVWQFSVKSFQSNSVLTELYICRVGLGSLPDDIDCFHVLEILDCQENSLQWLPDSVTSLTKLRIAIFSRNKLLYLPENIGNMSALEELWLDENQLGDLPSSCSDLQNLKWLDLYSNNLEDFPGSIEGLLSNLAGLDLELNRFQSISVVAEKVGSYSLLREAILKRLQGCYRGDGLKPFEEISEDDSERSSEPDFGSDCCSIASQDNSQNPRVSPDEEEKWDLDEGEDDYYDPTNQFEAKKPFCPGRALIINQLVIHNNSFCPSDLHPSPSSRPSKDPLAPDEGQFDDV